MSELRIGVDAGGTFTDFVVSGPDGLTVEKRLSSPDDPARSVLDGLESLDPEARSRVVHGSTVATNALLERRGARLAFVATQGFGDLLELGRGERRGLYDFEPPPRASLGGGGGGLIFELAERVAADGQVLREPSEAELERLAAQIAASPAEAVAVCLLFSYLRPEHERRLGSYLREHARLTEAVSLSVEVLPEIREYERASTTAVNAYVMPLMRRYLRRLARDAAPRPLSIMASHAGAIPPSSAARLPVSTVLSGPAAGVVGALACARRAGRSHCISFDMGGTSTDVALCEGELPYSSWTEIAGLPVHRPSVAVHTVGAGGGSIVRLDPAGGLHVGPESAGARPGPAAYGRGGVQPTLTDAQVVLGRLPADRPLAGGLQLDGAAARRAFEPLASGLATSIEDAALAAIRVAEARMERALRRVSVEEGRDPAEYCLIAFGGAAGLHACDLASAIGAREVLLPLAPGALSAFGLAMAPPLALTSRSVLRQAGSSAPDLEQVFAELRAEAEAQLGLGKSGISTSDGSPARGDVGAPGRVAATGGLREHRAAALRYAGQSWELDVEWPDDDDPRPHFEAAHRRRYGFVHAGRPIELVTLRLRLSGAEPRAWPALTSERTTAGQAGMREVVLPDGSRRSIPVLWRAALRAGQSPPVPSLLLQDDTTILLTGAWRAEISSGGDLLLRRG